MSYKPYYAEHLGAYDNYEYYNVYSNGLASYYRPSNSSFIDVVKREGVDNATIFETCLYPTQTAEIRTYVGPSTNPGTTHEKTYRYLGNPASQAEVHQVDCVMELLLNKLAESNWNVHSYHEYSDKHTLLFSRTTTT